MNDNELEKILNEIKNNKESKNSLDSNEFEEILNSLNSKGAEEELVADESTVDDEITDDTPLQTEPSQEPDSFKLEEKAETEDDDDDEFLPVHDIADDIDDEPSLYIFEDEAPDTVDEQEEPEIIAEENDETTETPDEVQEAVEEGIYFADASDAGLSNKKNSKKKAVVIVAVIVALALAVAVGVYYYLSNNNPNSETPTETKPVATETVEPVKEVGPVNPLTGESGYDESALTRRPVAVVVENEYSTSSVRPQWGLADADIVLEGESEYSTRLLLFWADYNKLPKQIGPTRSARPPFIRFSQLFDSVFIHAGLSRSKDNYVGADTVFETDNVDHINLLSFSESSPYFSRDKSRTSTIEHTGCLMGEYAAEMLNKSGFNLKLNENKFTRFSFNEEAKPLSANPANEVSFKWSKSYCPKLAKFSYDSEKQKYTTTDFDSKFGTSGAEWENLILILDETEYIVKHNYKHVGNSETYCDYKLSGGKGVVCSQGTCVEITWGVKNGKLWMKDSQDNEVKLNPGKTYIGYGSS
ncbi:DUF3048 domain-containing protein, partial [Eubacterium sp.]|uniref:DUF3048 domain-containing protein n=1 Tax=Eubacterium sp. TaxID=142586 RepID=UPI003F0FB972